MHTLAEFTAAVKACIKLASEKYGQMPNIDIKYDLKGRAAGYAGCQGNYFFMRFNKEAMQVDWDHMVNDTIPHEVAHIVQFWHKHLRDPDIWKGSRGYVRQSHGPKFKEICRLLGGSGDRCHTMELTKAKKKTVRRFIWTDNYGNEVRFTTKTHNSVMRAFALGMTKVPLRSGSYVCKCDYKRMEVVR